MSIRRNNTKIIYYFFVVIFFVGINKSYAANLFINADNGNLEINKTVAVNILINTSKTSINAISGKLIYPNDLLTATMVSADGSIISQWLPPGISEPKISDGFINFEGISIAGYKGSNGKIFSVVFKAKKEGNAQISFDSVQILSNAGKIANVAEASKGNMIKIIPAIEQSQTTISEVSPAVTVPIKSLSEISISPKIISPIEPLAAVKFSFSLKLIFWIFGLIIFLFVLVIILLVWILRLKSSLKELKKEFYSHRNHKI